MAQIRGLLTEIDALWKPIGPGPITLQVIGSAALMLQTDYDRGTKDGDVLESKTDKDAIKAQLLALAGKETDLHKRLRLYIDVVNGAILFLPQKPAFHPLSDLPLKNFSVEVLDVVDVALSKLRRFHSDDKNDIRAMADRGLLDHKRLVTRFNGAVDWFSMDARAPEVKRCLRNLHAVERDILVLPESEIELPESMQD